MPKTGLSSEEMVERTIEIAQDTIRQVGLDRFRLVDVAKGLGVTHAALYNHFPSKGAILDAISERWLNEMDEAMERVARTGGPSRLAILEWFMAYHRQKRNKVMRDPELYRSFNMAVEADKPFVLRHLENLHDQLLSLLERGADSGELDIALPERAMEVLFEATASFHHPVLVLEHKDEDRELLLQRVVSAVLAGLSATR
ncbi:TetR/AcrR family transcriptional regulator [Pseudodesulfovibrio methanolicus]|uniref:TetR/AcrR family transcriptional regulator n=1 Tax=Pseudodesulfovibrio methanolicus TaxID=3126690 RepID=A0ABZ2IS03_9BACT